MNNNFNFFSRLAWGNWQVSEELNNPTELAKIIETVFNNNIFVLDTADIYGGYKNEEILGKALNQLKLDRSTYQIITKANIFKDNPEYPKIKGHHYNSSYSYLKSAIERSLNKLQTPYIDLFLLHRLDYLMNPSEVAKVLKEFYNKGLIKAVGVSNFPSSTLRALQKHLDMPIVTNQIEFSLKHLQPLDDGSLDLALELGYKPMFWSPYARGEIFKDPEIFEVLSKFANQYDISPEAIATSWLLKHPSEGIVIVGSNSKDRISSIVKGVSVNLEVHEWYEILKSTGKILP